MPMTMFVRDHRLADALESALVTGTTSATSSELGELALLARGVAASTAAVEPSADFRARARERLVARMASNPARRQLQSTPLSVNERLAVWFMRIAGGLTAVSLVGVATANASAGALPGDPLYGVKQTAELVELQLAPNDAARADVLLNQADARLDETARLAQEGRVQDTLDSAQRYDEAVKHVEDAVLTPVQADTYSGDHAIDALEAHTAELDAILEQAPSPARAGLERARVAAERGLLRAAAAHDNAAHTGSPPVRLPQSRAPGLATPTEAPTATALTSRTLEPTLPKPSDHSVDPVSKPTGNDAVGANAPEPKSSRVDSKPADAERPVPANGGHAPANPGASASASAHDGDQDPHPNADNAADMASTSHPASPHPSEQVTSPAATATSHSPASQPGAGPSEAGSNAHGGGAQQSDPGRGRSGQSGPPKR